LSFVGIGTVAPIFLFFFSPFVHVEELDFLFAHFVVPDGHVWFYVIAMGIIATISQLLMTKAYGATKAGIVGAVSYTNILFSIIVGTILGDTLPDFLTSIGIFLIVFAGIMVAKEK